MKQITLSEICYYIFFALLLSAKGIGLYDGQGVFKIILVIALFFWIGKMALTEYSLKEILVMGALLLAGMLSYYYSGDKAALIAVMVITGMKNIPIKRLWKLGLICFSITFFGTVITALLGIRDTTQFVHNKGILGFVIRDSLGMPHPNVLHISYMVLIALWFMVCDFKGKSLYSLSYTGFLFLIAYLVLAMYLNLSRKRTKVENILLQCLMPVCVLFAILGPVTLKGRIFELVNKAVNTRFELSRHYLTSLRPTLFGTRVNIEGNYTIDCAYVHCLYYYGIVLFVLFMVGFFLLIKYLLKKERNHELAMVLGLIAAGFTEPFLFNFSFKNLILPLLGEWLFVYLAKEGKTAWTNKKFQLMKKDFRYEWKETKILQKIKRRWKSLINQYGKLLATGVLAGMIMGLIFGSIYVHAEPYVVVNKNTSDRVGKKGDYQIYHELSEEIKENSLKINIDGDDTKVFVLSGNIIRYQEVREKITICFFGGILGLAVMTLVLLQLQNRKKNDKDFNAG